MPPPVRVVLLLLGALSPDNDGALPVFGIVHARASGDSLESWPSKYSPLPFTSLRRVPVFSTMNSATSRRWWLAAIPYRSQRHPAWIEGIFRFTSIDLPACPCNTRCRLPLSSAENRGSSGYPNRCGRVGRDFTVGRNPLQVHSPYDISVKHAFLATHLRLNMPFREMLLTRQSVLPSLLPTAFRVPDIPRRTTCPHGPFVHSIVKLHGAHMDITILERRRPRQSRLCGHPFRSRVC